ncbi:MAG: non-canonical purine NTP pyrophosphatase [Candidatus Saccharibacteria bacterium]
MSETIGLVFGTTNPAKVLQIQGALAGTNVHIEGLSPDEVIDVPEDGDTAEVNARIKATAYAKHLGRTVFSMDNALYFDNLPDTEQPGLHVRRLGGTDIPATDEDMVAHYAAFVEQHGGRMTASWRFGVAIARADGSCNSMTIRSPRIFTGTPSEQRVSGYPLESLQLEPSSGKYLAELSEEDQAAFWQQTIGREIAEFVENHIS